MKKLIIYSGLFCLVTFFSCIKEKKKETCFDHIRNQNEVSEDCGGVCTPCPSCNDNIKNQDETAVDCGGVCNACASCEDGIKNQKETGIDCGDICQPCGTSACNTPLGYGEIAYLQKPNGRDTINNFSGAILDPNSESGIKFDLTFSFFPRSFGHFECQGFNVRFYGDAILKTQENTVQVFTTEAPDRVFNQAISPESASKCVLTITMPGTDLLVAPGEKIYVTKTGENKYNIKFCKLPVPKVNEYNFNTTFSSNLNFSFN